MFNSAQFTALAYMSQFLSYFYITYTLFCGYNMVVLLTTQTTVLYWGCDVNLKEENFVKIIYSMQGVTTLGQRMRSDIRLPNSCSHHPPIHQFIYEKNGVCKDIQYTIYTVFDQNINCRYLLELPQWWGF